MCSEFTSAGPQVGKRPKEVNFDLVVLESSGTFPTKSSLAACQDPSVSVTYNQLMAPMCRQVGI